MGIAHLNISDAVQIVLLTAFTVGGVKLAYALTPYKAVFNLKDERAARTATGGLVLGAGVLVITKA